jgi:Protein of unknown function (DUF2946)
MNLPDLRRTRALTTWLLAVFVLRSLIPVGFMPMIGPGHSLQLALCDGYAPVPSMPMSQSMDMSMDPQQDMPRPDHATHQDHGTCLFGSAPALGAPLALPALRVAQSPTVGIRTLAPQIVHHEVPDRAQSARGPPV